MSQMTDFIIRENIRHFNEQLLMAVEGPRKVTIRALLAKECRLLRNAIAESE